jgi:hypothetical protein
MCKDWEVSDQSRVTRARTRKRQPNRSREVVPANGISPGVFDCGGSSGVCQTLEIVFPDRLHFGRRRPDAAELRAHAKASGGLPEERIDACHGQGSHLRGVRRGQSSKLRSTLPARCMASTSSRSMKSSDRGRSGVSRMRSRPHSRSWMPSRSSKPPPS